MAQDGTALGYASAELRGDKEVVLAAVKQYGDALEYASAELRGDKEVVLAAVAEDGTALGYASAELRNDKEAVLAAVAENDWALIYASAELRGDKQNFSETAPRPGAVGERFCHFTTLRTQFCLPFSCTHMVVQLTRAQQLSSRARGSNWNP